MRYKDYAELLVKARTLEPARVAVCAAGDRDVLEGVKLALAEKLILPTLVGDRNKIEQIAAEIALDLHDLEVVHEPDPVAATHRGVDLVAGGNADLLMKGLVNTADFLRAVLRKDNGLRTGRLISHLLALQIPGFEHLLWLTDAAMIIAPNLEEKSVILQNALDFLHDLGMDEIKTVALSANEVPSPKMISSMDAQRLMEMNQAGAFPGAIVEGPLALDGALSAKALKHKGIKSVINGDPDLLLMPNVEVGNVLTKAIIYLAEGLLAGIVLGAKAPIVLTSRNDPPESKLISMALAVLMLRRNA